MSEINLRAIRGELQIDGSIGGDDDRAIITILDFYEFICQGALEGSLSRRAIREIRGGAMKTTFQICEQYIVDRRKMLSRPRLYWAYERFVKDHVDDGHF
jgi:hypothetical protein